MPRFPSYCEQNASSQLEGGGLGGGGLGGGLGSVGSAGHTHSLAVSLYTQGLSFRHLAIRVLNLAQVSLLQPWVGGGGLGGGSGLGWAGWSGHAHSLLTLSYTQGSSVRHLAPRPLKRAHLPLSQA